MILDVALYSLKKRGGWGGRRPPNLQTDCLHDGTIYTISQRPRNRVSKTQRTEGSEDQGTRDHGTRGPRDQRTKRPGTWPNLLNPNVGRTFQKKTGPLLARCQNDKQYTSFNVHHLLPRSPSILGPSCSNFQSRYQLALLLSYYCGRTVTPTATDTDRYCYWCCNCWFCAAVGPLSFLFTIVAVGTVDTTPGQASRSLA